MDTLTFSIVRAARMILEREAKEKELLDKLRFINLPQGGTKMGSLMKLVEKTAETTEEVQYTLADTIKIASANLVNYINAVKEQGGEIKTASLDNVEINRELIQKTANLIVIDHYDLYKEAGIKPEWLTKLIDKIRQSGVVQKTIHPMRPGSVLSGAVKGVDIVPQGYLRSLLDTEALKTVVDLAGKKGVQLGAAGAGGVGAGLGLGQLLKSTED